MVPNTQLVVFIAAVGTVGLLGFATPHSKPAAMENVPTTSGASQPWRPEGNVPTIPLMEWFPTSPYHKVTAPKNNQPHHFHSQQVHKPYFHGMRRARMAQALLKQQHGQKLKRPAPVRATVSQGRFRATGSNLWAGKNKQQLVAADMK